MAFVRIWLFLFISLLWTKTSWSKEIKYKDLARLVTFNQKSKSLDLIVESEKKRTGFLTRSIVPELKAFAGLEEFDSDRLGDQTSNFYGVEARVNLFNGMSDYWEEERRKLRVKLSKIQRKVSLSEMAYKAKRSYLKLAEAQRVKDELNDSLAQLSGVLKKVRLKVKGGVISKSDLTLLRLVRVELEHKTRDMEEVIVLESARLKSLLSLSDFNVSDIDEDILSLKSSDQKRLSGKFLLKEKFKAESASFDSESKVLSGKALPSVELVANYGRKPYSAREFSRDSEREEWSAGVQLTWKIGSSWENSRQAQSSKLKAQASEELGGHYSVEVKNYIEALEQKSKSLSGSIMDLEKEISLSKNYYSQISSEYLRGVKSTSDLTSIFGQLLELKKHRLKLLLQYHLAQAEMEKIRGGF